MSVCFGHVLECVGGLEFQTESRHNSNKKVTSMYRRSLLWVNVRLLWLSTIDLAGEEAHCVCKQRGQRLTKLVRLVRVEQLKQMTCHISTCNIPVTKQLLYCVQDHIILQWRWWRWIWWRGRRSGCRKNMQPETRNTMASFTSMETMTFVQIIFVLVMQIPTSGLVTAHAAIPASTRRRHGNRRCKKTHHELARI